MYTKTAAIGSHGTMDEQHFFELAGDLTVRVDFAVSFDEANKLLKLAETQKITMFYAELPVEFGVTGNGD